MWMMSYVWSVAAPVVAGLIATLTLAFPLSAAAVGIPFGGKITSVIQCSDGRRHITVLDPRGIVWPTIWMPTINYLNTPPYRVGQHILGLLGVWSACKVGKVWIPGFQQTMIGTSF